MIFVAAWTMLILIYLSLAPRFFSSLANVFAILALDALTMLFWFAGFIALAVLYNAVQDSAVLTRIGFADVDVENTCDYDRGLCREMEAAVVFGAFEWYVSFSLPLLFFSYPPKDSFDVSIRLEEGAMS